MRNYVAQFGKLPERTKSSILLRSLAIFAVATAVTGIAAWDAWRADRETGRVRFDAIAEKVITSIEENMDAYEQVLHGGVALFDAVGNVSRKQWTAYVNGLQLSKSYPGIQGVGFAAVYDPKSVDDLERAVRMEGLQDFTVHPRQESELSTTILFLEPLDWRNRRALGYDMYSEPVRRSAMKRALETGNSAVSGGVTLLQETKEDVQRGVLLYLPLYHETIDMTAPGGVTRNLRGFVYSAFRMGDLMTRVLSRTDGYSSNIMRVELFDGPQAAPENLLADNASSKAARTDPEYTYDKTVPIHGRTWHARMSSLPEFHRQVSSYAPWIMALAGLLLGTLASALFGFINTGKEIAHFVADQLAQEVDHRKEAEEQARVAMRELAHRVKNTLTIVTSIASQTVRHSADLSEFDGKFRERLLGLGRVHDLLTSGRSYSTDLEALAREVLKPYQGENPEALTLDGPTAKLAPNFAIMLSMLFNELATNATKYGAWSVRTGAVDLNWRLIATPVNEVAAPNDDVPDEAQQLLQLIWRESGGPPVKPPTRQGFGSNVIKFSVERSLRGRADADFDPAGVVYTIQIPWDAETTTAGA